MESSGRSIGILGPVILAVAAGALLLGCSKPEPKGAAQEPAKVVTADVMTVGEEAANGGFIVTGTVASRYNAILSSKAVGRVVSVLVREGDQVRKGQMLLAIDGRELEAAVNRADANYRASVAGVGSAKTAVAMEERSSQARIVQAEAQVEQARAALASAVAHRDLAVAGTRVQEINQSHIAVVQAESNLKFAKVELDRTTRLVEAGAIARRDLDLAQNRYDLAKGQHETALQAEALAKEGSRTQEIRAAEEAVNEARAALRQAQTGVVQARAAALQVDVRKKDVEVASAQVHQASAAVRSAEVGLSYTKVTAPFDGRVVGRMVDPGTMASPGVPLLAIEGGDPLLEAVVPERHLGGAAVGRTVDVQIDALGGRAIKGTVVETVPKGDATTHSFTVKIGLGHDPALKAGMFGTAVLPTGSVKRIFVPATAVWESDGLELVYALNSDGTARLRIVTLGEASGGRVEVLSGLSAGDRIVVGDRSGVSDGVTVKARAR